MAFVQINDTVFPAISADILAEYPYVVIVHLSMPDYGVKMGMLMASKKPIYFIPSETEGVGTLDAIGTTDFMSYTAAPDGLSWENENVNTETQIGLPVGDANMVLTVQGANHNILITATDAEGNTVATNEVYFAGSEIVTLPDEMGVPVSTLIKLGNSARRFGGIAEKQTVEQMEEVFANFVVPEDYLMQRLNGTLEEYFSDDVGKVSNGAFWMCNRLKSVSLPNATHIFREGFNYCTALETVNIPAVTVVREQAFVYCSTLSKLDLPSVTEIYYMAFAMCEALTTIILRAGSVCKLFKDGNPGEEEEGYGQQFFNINENLPTVYVPSVLLNQYKANAAWIASGVTLLAIEDHPDICGA